MRTTLALALIVSIAPTLTAAQPRDDDPLTLAQQYCDLRVTRGDMHTLDPHVSPQLAKLLEDHANSMLAAAVPWQGWIYHPTACTAEATAGSTGTTGAVVKLNYIAPERGWSDTLHFQRTPDGWLIDNVSFDGGGNLRATLFHWLYG